MIHSGDFFVVGIDLRPYLVSLLFYERDLLFLFDLNKGPKSLVELLQLADNRRHISFHFQQILVAGDGDGVIAFQNFGDFGLEIP